MNKAILTVVSFLLFCSSLVMANECDALVANYDVVAEQEPPPTLRRLEIRSEAEDVLSIQYLTQALPDPGHTSSYILDGNPHEGDRVYSGDSYIAGCDRGELIVSTIWNQLKDPLVYRLALGGPKMTELYFVEKTGKTIRTTRFRRAR